MLALLRPWSTYVNVSNISHVDSLDEGQINHTLWHFIETERSMGSICKRRNEFNLAEDYCQRALSHARLFDGKEELKTGLLYSTLIGLYEIYEIKDSMTKHCFLSKKPIIVLLLLIIRSILLRYRMLPVRSSNVSSIRGPLTLQKLLYTADV
jgi:hypothetical protein